MTYDPKETGGESAGDSHAPHGVNAANPENPENPENTTNDANGPNAAGAGAEWGIAKVVESPEEAALIVGFLQNNGVPAEIESLHVEELPVTVGGLGEIRIRVPADRLSEALALLASQEQAPPEDLEEMALGAQTGSPADRSTEPQDEK